MIDLACPKCGRGGTIPREKVNSRLVCKKCHVIFHVTTAGRTVLGEPHHEVPKTEAPPSSGIALLSSIEGLDGLKESITSIPPKNVGIGAAALALAIVAWFILSMPGESLADRTALTAKKFAEDDLAYLKAIASTETVDDVVRWFDAVHPKLVKAREQWKTHSTDVRVMVIDENTKQRVGEAEAFVYPMSGPQHVASIKDAAEAAPTRIEPVDLKLHWTLDSRGKWRLNGQQTLQAAGLSGTIESASQP